MIEPAVGGSAHSQVVALLDQIRQRVASGQLTPKSRADIESATDTIETLSRATVMPGEDFDWRPYLLTPSEWKIAEVLRARIGRVVSKDALFDLLYAARANDPPEKKTLEVIVHHLRQKLKVSPFVIETSWGIGFTLLRREDCDIVTRKNGNQSYIALKNRRVSDRGLADRARKALDKLTA